MTKSKRSAEDIARLFHKECEPPPPSEWPKIFAWLEIETRNTTRQAWRWIGPMAFFVFCQTFAVALVTFLSSSPAKPSGIWFAYMPVFFSGACIVLLCFLPRLYGAHKRALLHGFLHGVQVSKPGAPKKWTIEFYKETVAAVQAIAAERGMSIARSIDILKQREPEQWRSLSEARYYEAMKQLEKST